MAFQSNGLRDAFEGQGEPGFMVWTYASFDPLEAILEPGYFTGLTRFRIGDLVYVGTSPRPADSPWTRLQTSREVRRALLMIKGRDERGRVQVRLVQDYGGPDDGDGPNDGRNDGDGPISARAVSPVKRGRGRVGRGRHGCDQSSVHERVERIELKFNRCEIFCGNPARKARQNG